MMLICLILQANVIRMIVRCVPLTALIALHQPAVADELSRRHLSALAAIQTEIEAGIVTGVRSFIEKHYQKSRELLDEPSNLVNYMLGSIERDGVFLPKPDAVEEAMKTALFTDPSKVEFLLERVRLNLATFDSINKFVDDLKVSRKFYINLFQQLALQADGSAIRGEASMKFVFSTCDPAHYRGGDVDSLSPEFVRMLLGGMSPPQRKKVIYYVAAKTLSAECVREIFTLG